MLEFAFHIIIFKQISFKFPYENMYLYVLCCCPIIFIYLLYVFFWKNLQNIQFWVCIQIWFDNMSHTLIFNYWSWNCMKIKNIHTLIPGSNWCFIYDGAKFLCTDLKIFFVVQNYARLIFTAFSEKLTFRMISFYFRFFTTLGIS